MEFWPFFDQEESMIEICQWLHNASDLTENQSEIIKILNLKSLIWKWDNIVRVKISTYFL